MKTLPIITGVLVGADIELFLQDKTTQEIVSAEGFIKGTKYDPFNFDATNKYFATSLDNVLAEFSIPPAKHVDEFVEYISRCLDYINKSIPETLCTVARPSAILDQRFLQTQNAMTFGCEPDYNVYLRAANPKPAAPNPNLRSGGGHIHIGYDGASDETQEDITLKEYIVKSLDLFLGIPSILQEPDNERKLLYGKAGAFRFKEYGIEYRQISNYYLSSKELIEWAFKNSHNAINFLNNGYADAIDSVEAQVQEAINTCNKTIAQNLINQFNIPMA